MPDNIPPTDELTSGALHGAESIAIFLYGDAQARRNIYRFVETRRQPIAVDKGARDVG